MIKIITLFCLLCVPAFAVTNQESKFAHEQARHIREVLLQGDIVTVAAQTDQALDALVSKAIEKLVDNGDSDFATASQTQWNAKFHGFLTRMVLSHDIGDHAPLIEWLATFYDSLEKKLGVTVCKLTHLSDIKTFNFCIPVVFHPTTFPMDAVSGARAYEYLKHCNQGAVYFGLLPVVTYWVADIACTAATYGGGAVMLCGIVGTIAEEVMAKFFGDKVCEYIYTKAGGQ